MGQTQWLKTARIKHFYFGMDVRSCLILSQCIGCVLHLGATLQPLGVQLAPLTFLNAPSQVRAVLLYLYIPPV